VFPSLIHEAFYKGFSSHFLLYQMSFIHLRFLKILPPSLYSPVTYSKPVSIKAQASLMLVATLTKNWSSVGLKMFASC